MAYTRKKREGSLGKPAAVAAVAPPSSSSDDDAGEMSDEEIIVSSLGQKAGCYDADAMRVFLKRLGVVFKGDK